MSTTTTRISVILLALVASFALVQAAGGIKGAQRGDDSQQRLSGVKGPRQQQVQQQAQQQPIQQQQIKGQAPIKGPGQVAPVFTAAKVQPIQQQQVIQQQEQEPEQQQQQQQQQVQESEVDPSAAAQDSAAALAAPASPAAAAAANEEEANPKPEPYAFNYAFESGDSATSGSSQREETQDASGKVTGFYTLRGEDGRDRRVDYIADANGFRATISTNEMGTAPKDSADVDWQAQAPSDAQLRTADLATQAARQRALAEPQQKQLQQLQQQPLASGSSPSKVSSPRQNAAASQQRESFAPTKGQQQQQQQQIVQLQEPFEQIRQTELNARARKSRHAPFYLFTV